jgi:hypothetical protein
MLLPEFLGGQQQIGHQVAERDCFKATSRVISTHERYNSITARPPSCSVAPVLSLPLSRLWPICPFLDRCPSARRGTTYSRL